MKILLATQKPFAAAAVAGIRNIVEEAGYELAILEKYESAEELKAAAADADAIIVRSDKVTKEVIEAAKSLKIVVRAGAGFDNLDLEACSAHGVVAMNTPGQNSNAVAELAIAMMIFMSRNQFTPATGSEIQGKTLGIEESYYLSCCGKSGIDVGLCRLSTHFLRCSEDSEPAFLFHLFEIVRSHICDIFKVCPLFQSLEKTGFVYHFLSCRVHQSCAFRHLGYKVIPD